MAGATGAIFMRGTIKKYSDVLRFTQMWSDMVRASWFGVEEWLEELGLEGFDDDGQSQAEAALRNADSAGFTPFQEPGGVGKRGFGLVERGGLVDEVVEVREVAVTEGQERKEVAAIGGITNLGQGKVGGAMADDAVEEEGEVVEAWVKLAGGGWLKGSGVIGHAIAGWGN
jgi:hypothetical protein